MEDAQGQRIATVKGNFTEHNYKMLAREGSLIAQINKNWVTIRDSYCNEISRPDFDPFLVLSYVIAMDDVDQKSKASKSRF
jgi:uncharacterized protein YxjI